jgi:hypothetical protein
MESRTAAAIRVLNNPERNSLGKSSPVKAELNDPGRVKKTELNRAGRSKEETDKEAMSNRRLRNTW